MSMPEADPALVFSKAVQGPGTHVLVVGIGDYPHLLGGAQANAEVAEGMGQLQAPPRSAREMARWFLDDFNNADRPLASLSLVLSEPEPAKFVHPSATHPRNALPRGTANETVDAIGAWMDRASVDRGNMCVFYFCGHGVSAGESILILRDFGAKPRNRFDGSLNLNDFLGAMQTMTPEYQLFVVDSCRVPTAVARSALGAARLGRQSLDPTDLAKRGGKPARQSVHHSSSALATSFGRKAGNTLYTDALIHALNGGGMQANLRQWVGTLGLQTALAAYTARIAVAAGVEQQPEVQRSVEFPLHKPRNVLVPLYVACDPAAALQEARIEALLDGAVAAHKASGLALASSEWMVPLAVREHTVNASFGAASTYVGSSQTVVVTPPETPCTIPCRRQP